MGEGFELSGLRKDGSEFPVEIMLSPLDRTEQSEEDVMKTARELKRSNNQLQQFVYVASHDLEDPLCMVASFTQRVAMRYEVRLDSDADEFIAFASVLSLPLAQRGTAGAAPDTMVAANKSGEFALVNARMEKQC